MIKSGSSSIKFRLFAIAPEPSALCRGTINAAAGATMVHQVFECVAECYMRNRFISRVNSSSQNSSTKSWRSSLS
jgi:acetate kinase